PGRGGVDHGRRAGRRAGPEAALGPGDRRSRRRLSDGVRDARRRGVHARGDRRDPWHRDRNVESATVASTRQAARCARGLRGRVDLMTDDRFEQRLRQAAQDYHRPPATPREELWRRLAAAQYLTRTEALLTGFRAETRAGVPTAQFSVQARDLLCTTRLMLDSPAARDVRLKSLLEDLELVLAQIAQLPSSGDRDDVQL